MVIPTGWCTTVCVPIQFPVMTNLGAGHRYKMFVVVWTSRFCLETRVCFRAPRYKIYILLKSIDSKVLVVYNIILVKNNNKINIVRQLRFSNRNYFVFRLLQTLIAPPLSMTDRYISQHPVRRPDGVIILFIL